MRDETDLSIILEAAGMVLVALGLVLLDYLMITT